MQTRDPAAQTAAASAGLGLGWGQAGRVHTFATLALAAVLTFGIVAIAGFFHNSDSGTSDSPIAGLESIAWPSGEDRQRQPAPTATKSTSIASVDSMIAGLEERLAREPGDAKGWALLAQSYAFLGNSLQAEAALEKAVALGMEEENLRQRVNLASNSPAQPSRGNLLPSSVVIHGLVKLASATPVELAPESRLFVTARATDGSTVPVAVLGQRVTDFPFQFMLGDENAMMPGVKLSDFEEIALSARISQSGTAERSDDDLVSPVKLIRPAEPGWVDLVIENR